MTRTVGSAADSLAPTRMCEDAMAMPPHVADRDRWRIVAANRPPALTPTPRPRLKKPTREPDIWFRSMLPLGGFFDQAQICVFRYVQAFLDESNGFCLVDARLHHLEIGLGIHVAIKVLFGEEPAVERGRRPLEIARGKRDGLLAVR